MMTTLRIASVFVVFVFLVIFVWLANNYRSLYENEEVASVVNVIRAVSDIHEDFLLFKEPVPGEENIFFLQTKCGEDKGAARLLNPRQACAMESAALMNPSASVYLLHVCELKRESILKGPEYVRELFTYPKVHLSQLQFMRRLKDTPLEKWSQEELLLQSMYPTEHTSDVLRYVMLWKYGGTYLDHDVVLMRSLSGMSNFAGAESLEDVAAGVLNFAHDGVGHEMVTACLEDLRTQFRGDSWGHNGPGVITRVLRQVCGVRKVRHMTPERCRGFTVHPPSAFYPIPWQKWRLYFDEKDADRTMSKLNESLAIHVWNKFSVAENITVGSRQPYAQIAKKFCPKVYSHCGKIF
ncbi:lactosylceramide 4-alpha-galactosyltransferase isoform X1 [Anabrus simplex]|uniref:lactosylceramide 4-alpha-galactosyltransferase isoform X1 n=1 Tax=Anabrus simplex TaxID=316456 RepID=UPI0035A37F1C